MIVDDHAIVRVVLQQVLDQSGEFEVVGQEADGEGAVRVIADVSPDVVVMGVMMPKKDEVEACGEIMEAAPETRVRHANGLDGGGRHRGGGGRRRSRMHPEGDGQGVTAVSRAERTAG